MKKLTFLLLFLLFLLPAQAHAEIFTLDNTKNPLDLLPKPDSQYINWGVQAVNAQQFWKEGFTGKNIKIAILDTGIDYTHPDLHVAGGVSFIPGVKSYMDDNGHGTNVAGIAGALNNNIGSVGVSPNSKLYAVKVMASDGSGTVEDLIKGIKWCINNHMDIINMSLALTPDETKKPTFKQLANVIHQAYLHNILIVAAAGNEAKNQVDYPANFPDVIAVSAIQQYYYPTIKRDGFDLAFFSNFGSKIEVTAPGTFIYNTYPMSMTPTFNLYPGYDALTGTSMAAPFVTGFLADLKQKYPKLNNDFILPMRN